jgi:hypothetical protein
MSVLHLRAWPTVLLTLGVLILATMNLMLVQWLQAIAIYVTSSNLFPHLAIPTSLLVRQSLRLLHAHAQTVLRPQGQHVPQAEQSVQSAMLVFLRTVTPQHVRRIHAHAQTVLLPQVLRALQAEQRVQNAMQALARAATPQPVRRMHVHAQTVLRPQVQHALQAEQGVQNAM